MHPLSLRSATSTYHHRLRLRALRERRLDALGFYRLKRKCLFPSSGNAAARSG